MSKRPIALPLVACAAALTLAAFSSIASAQVSASNLDKVTLSTAIDRAQACSPAMRAAGAGLDVAQANLDAAGLRPNPTLSIERENIAGDGIYAGSSQAETTFSLTMPLDLGGKRAANEMVARAEHTGATVAATANKADVVLRTTLAVVDVAAAKRLLTLAQERLALAEHGANAALQRVKTGKASPIEQSRADVVRVNAAVAVDRADRALRNARMALARLTGANGPVDVETPWFDHFDVIAPATADGNLAIAATVSSLQAARARLVLAQRSRMPDVSVSAGLRRFNATGEKAAVVGLSVPLPLFNRGDTEVRRARAELDRVSAEGDSTRLETEQQLASARSEVDDARAEAQAASGTALSAAVEGARIARIGYAEGKFTQLDLLDAERSLAETHESAIKAAAGFHAARARLARLQGHTDPIEKD